MFLFNFLFTRSNTLRSTWPPIHANSAYILSLAYCDVVRKFSVKHVFLLRYASFYLLFKGQSQLNLRGDNNLDKIRLKK